MQTPPLKTIARDTILVSLALIAIFSLALIFIPTTTPEQRADFAAWEAQHAVQEGRGAIKTKGAAQ